MNDKNLKNEEKEPEFVLLTTIYDNFKLNAVKGILEDSEIPYILSAADSNEFLRVLGGVLNGTNVLVADYSLEKSRELLNVIFGDTFEEDNKNIEEK